MQGGDELVRLQSTMQAIEAACTSIQVLNATVLRFVSLVDGNVKKTSCENRSNYFSEI